MLPQNPVKVMNEYGSQSQYLTGPSPKEIAAGVVPLDTLPADWWNWLWQQLTQRVNETSNGLGSLFNEVLSVLQDASITPTPSSTTQLLDAIKTISRTIGNTGLPGAVRSSPESGKVIIDSLGYMTPNGMGVPSQLNTTSKLIVDAINEVLLSLNNYKSSNDSSIVGLNTSKAPNDHASENTTYGVGTETKYGHLKITDLLSLESSDTAASAKALKLLKDQLDSVLGVASGAVPTGTIVAFGGANPPVGWLLCDGTGYRKTDYPALYNVIGEAYKTDFSSDVYFNVPDLRESTPEGVGTRSKGITDAHDALTLGQFKENTSKRHTHEFTGTAVTSGGPSTANTGSTTPTFTGSAVTSGGPSTANTGSTTPTFTGSAVTSGSQSNDHTHNITDHCHMERISRVYNNGASVTTEYLMATTTTSKKYAGIYLYQSSANGIDIMTGSSSGRNSGLLYKNGSDYFGVAMTTSSALSLAATPSPGDKFTINSGTTSTGHTHSVTASGTVSSHTHTLSSHTHSVTASGTVSSHTHTLSSHTHSVTAKGTNSNSGGTTTHGNILGVNYIIKT